MELVECKERYWEFIRNLRNDKEVSHGFNENTYITEDMQQAYMKKYSDFYRVALIDDNPVGYVGVIDDDIRVCTHPDHQKGGVGKFMISKIMDIFPTAYAKVKLGNTASDNLFLSLGFSISDKDEQFTYYKKQDDTQAI